jgi:anti-sigma factor RsiW
MSSPCENLDGYLGRWLREPELLAFVAHLESCPRCRQAVNEQREVDRLLKQAAASDGRMPPEFVNRIEERLVRARRRRVVFRAAALAAGVLLALGVSVWMLRKPGATHDVAQAPPVEHPVPAPAPRVATRVVLSPSTGLTAVPIRSNNPDVTIVWLFPGSLRTAAR